jgi:hypothetical protein
MYVHFNFRSLIDQSFCFGFKFLFLYRAIVSVHFKYKFFNHGIDELFKLQVCQREDLDLGDCNAEFLNAESLMPNP